jgi:hypothetical protein
MTPETEAIMIQAIIEAFKREITKYNLELLQRYPTDLEIDMAVLEHFISPGLKYAWMVGDSHTHSAPLGVHQERNELPTYVTRLSNNDRFYLLSIGNGPDQFTLKEVDRAAFAALVNTPIPYKMTGSFDSFWLYRNESRVGNCIVTCEGMYRKPMYKIALTPVAGISKLDRAALQEWGQQAVVKKTGSLFAPSQVEWQDEIKLQLAA